MRFWILSQALRRIVEKHLPGMPADVHQAFFERFLQPIRRGFLQTFPLEHERAKYAELFSLLFLRTGTSTLKEAFKALKAIFETKTQDD